MANRQVRIAVALDVPSLLSAHRLVAELKPHVDYFKVGLQLLHSEGTPSVLRVLQGEGARLMVDWKLHDIPETVKLAAEAIRQYNVAYFNLHATTGRASISAAITARGGSKVMGVTVLTSLDDAECTEIFGAAADIKVPQFARTFVSLGGHAIICSAKEAQLLRSMRELDSAELWTPGIRPVWAAAGDQKRVLSPADAVRAGADVLIIGRPITQPPGEIGSPVEVTKRIRAEIEEALAA